MFVTIFKFIIYLTSPFGNTNSLLQCKMISILGNVVLLHYLVGDIEMKKNIYIVMTSNTMFWTFFFDDMSYWLFDYGDFNRL